MANSPLKFAIPGIADMMKQIQAKSQKEKEIKAGTYKGDATYQAKTAPTITPQPDMTPKTKMPSNMNTMTTNMTDNKMPMEDEVMQNNVGLTGTGSGSSAVANGPRGNDYSDLVSGSGAMNKIKDNTSAPFKMKESPFPMDDLSGDDKITKKDVLIGRGVIDIKGNKIED
tara:strand:- start:79 stop:588 length:510 start_codon:yes stop_codon:yes gene_type:complete